MTRSHVSCKQVAAEIATAAFTAIYSPVEVIPVVAALAAAAECNGPTPALCRSGYTGPEATIRLNSALSHILRRVVSG